MAVLRCLDRFAWRTNTACIVLLHDPRATQWKQCGPCDTRTLPLLARLLLRGTSLHAQTCSLAVTHAKPKNTTAGTQSRPACPLRIGAHMHFSIHHVLKLHSPEPASRHPASLQTRGGQRQHGDQRVVSGSQEACLRAAAHRQCTDEHCCRPWERHASVPAPCHRERVQAGAPLSRAAGARTGAADASVAARRTLPPNDRVLLPMQRSRINAALRMPAQPPCACGPSAARRAA